jgi:lysophospholipase L1-like esterase
LALRFTDLGPGRNGIHTVSSAEYEAVPGIFSPNQEAEVDEIRHLVYAVEIDSLGYRGADLPRFKPEGEIRLLYAGDSFVFGDFVEDDETLPAQTEKALSLRCTVPIRVVNAGVGGSTITESVQMIERGLTLDPDVVLLLFSENDVQDLAFKPMWDQLAENRRTKGRFPFSVVYPLVRRTALGNLVLKAYMRIRQRRGDPQIEISAGEHGDAVEPSPDVDAARAQTLRLRGRYQELLSGLEGSLTQRGIPFLVTVMPSHLSVYERRESDQLAWLDEMTRDIGVRTVSFFDVLRSDGRDETELYLLPFDGHASPEGYRVVSAKLADSLVALPVLSQTCD